MRYNAFDDTSWGSSQTFQAKEAAKAFGRAGWQVTGQVCSHLVMTKAAQRANLAIPQHKELSVGTLRALIRAAEMTVEEFTELL